MRLKCFPLGFNQHAVYWTLCSLSWPYTDWNLSCSVGTWQIQTKLDNYVAIPAQQKSILWLTSVEGTCWKTFLHQRVQLSEYSVWQVGFLHPPHLCGWKNQFFWGWMGSFRGSISVNPALHKYNLYTNITVLFFTQTAIWILLALL